MDDVIFSAVDARQTDQWGEYLSLIGWRPERVENTLVLIKKLGFLPWSMMKVLHPIGPIPFAKIDALAKKYRALLIIIEPHQKGFQESEYKKHGYRLSVLRYTHTATIKIDLRPSEQAIFKEFSENAKRNIKKAENFKLRIETVFLKNERSNDQFNLFYDLLFNLHEMKQFYIPSHEEYLKKMTAFKDTSILLFAYEKGGTKPIGAIWMAYYKNVISYLQTGITEKGYDLLANYLLVWEGLKLAKKLKLDVFDFETIYDPRYPKDHVRWKGYTEFKKRFHGNIVEYPPSWIKLYNPFFKVFYLCTSMFAK